MQLYDIKLTITAIEEKIDENGAKYLKAKGYNIEKYKGRNIINRFNSIKLYGVHDLLQETILRWYAIPDTRPKMKIICYQGDLKLTKMYEKNMAFLTVYYYDFVQRKFGTKKIMKEDYKKLMKGE